MWTLLHCFISTFGNILAATAAKRVRSIKGELCNWGEAVHSIAGRRDRPARGSGHPDSVLSLSAGLAW
eukprot:4524681-Alexandrium_andersonii.AAC.1